MGRTLYGWRLMCRGGCIAGAPISWCDMAHLQVQFSPRTVAKLSSMFHMASTSKRPTSLPSRRHPSARSDSISVATSIISRRSDSSSSGLPSPRGGPASGGASPTRPMHSGVGGASSSRTGRGSASRRGDDAAPRSSRPRDTPETQAHLLLGEATTFRSGLLSFCGRRWSRVARSRGSCRADWPRPATAWK